MSTQAYTEGASNSFCRNYLQVEFFYQINQFELTDKVLHHGGGSC